MKQQGKTFEIRGEQTHEIIEERLLKKGKSYEPVEPVRPKVKTVNRFKPMIYKPKGIKPEKPTPRYPGNNQQERMIISLQERLYELELALTKRIIFFK